MFNHSKDACLPACFLHSFAAAFARAQFLSLNAKRAPPNGCVIWRCAGHIQILKGCCYVLSQVVGAVFASLIIVRFCSSCKSPGLVARAVLVLFWRRYMVSVSTYSSRGLTLGHWHYYFCLCVLVCKAVSTEHNEIRGTSCNFACVLAQAGLVPGSHIGMGNSGTGCFAPGAGVSNGVDLLLSLFLSVHRLVILCPSSRFAWNKALSKRLCLSSASHAAGRHSRTVPNPGLLRQTTACFRRRCDAVSVCSEHGSPAFRLGGDGFLHPGVCRVRRGHRQPLLWQHRALRRRPLPRHRHLCQCVCFL